MGTKLVHVRHSVATAVPALSLLPSKAGTRAASPRRARTAACAVRTTPSTVGDQAGRSTPHQTSEIVGRQALQAPDDVRRAATGTLRQKVEIRLRYSQALLTTAAKGAGHHHPPREQASAPLGDEVCRHV
eukprot:5005574-Prymnesium_polylepis.1